MVASERRRSSSPDHVRKGNRSLAVLVTFILLVSLTPTLPLAGAQEGNGYLVFRDMQQIGPDLDLVFHVVVPDDASVVSATLDLYGTRGIMPVDGSTMEDGEHNHSLMVEGLHGHRMEDNAGHTHDVNMTGEHEHDVYVYVTVQDVNDSRMEVTLPGHTHTFNGFTWKVDDYTFPPIVSNGHNHTADPHEHSTLIIDSGEHGHMAEEDGGHLHDLEVTGDHYHNSSTAGFHGHSLDPGWSEVKDSTRPSAVNVTFTFNQSTETLPGAYGDSEDDWHERVDVSSNIIPGVTEVRLTALTTGSLEYVLTVEVDGHYGIISGHSPLGDEVPLQVPIFGPPESVSARLYLFGDDLPMVTDGTVAGGNHTHEAMDAGGHNHSVDPVGDHTHQVSGGDHEHNGTVSSAAPTTTSTEPYWSLPGHRHDLTWNGNQVTAMGGHSYGTVQSTDHEHTVTGHDHIVDLNVSGNHTHDLSLGDVHNHTSSITGMHTHDVADSGLHDHDLPYDPKTSSTGGPTGVSLELDGVDMPPIDGGELTGDPVIVDLPIIDWDVPHFLNMTAVDPGEVEWVVLLELFAPIVVVSIHGLAGEVMAHLPTPGPVAGARVGVLGNQYVMPLSDGTSIAGLHDHVTTSNGSHGHATTVDGVHVHELLPDVHSHGLTLEATAIVVKDANATIGLGSHNHDIQQNAFMTSSTSISANTGDHSHETEPHDHALQWDTDGAHVHGVTPGGNHTHGMTLNGTHGHVLQYDGLHVHEVMAGVGWENSYPTLADLIVKVGDHPGIDLTGGEPGWWEEFTVNGASLAPGDVQTFDASAGELGTMSVVVWFLLDVEPPTPVLIFAPDWVRPGDTFPVVVGFPDDVDPATVGLEIGPVEVTDTVFDDVNFTVNFTCSAPAGVTEGMYDINVHAADMAGNSATTTVGTLGIDGTPPVVMAEVGEPNVPGNGFTWVTSGTPVTLNITDGLSGPAGVEYAFSTDGPWTPYDPLNDTILDGRPEGTTQLFHGGSDNAGNTASVGSIDLNIDDTAPVATISVDPSTPGPGEDQVKASLASLISFSVDDGDGVGTAVGVEYRTVKGSTTGSWRLFDRAFPVSEVVASGGSIFTIEWRAEDLLGNADPVPSSLEVVVDSVPPVPSPEGDLFLPSHVTTTPYTMTGHIPGDVALFHFRTDTGDAGKMEIEPETTFHFDLDLVEGPNILTYALEDGVGNISPWVVAGTIVLDTVPPEMIGSSPAAESELNPVKGLTVIVQFSEPVGNVQVTAKGAGNELATGIEMAPGNTSAAITFDEDLPSSKWINMELTFEDNAGHEGQDAFRFKTGTPAEESVMGYIWGLVAGLIIGAIVVFFITFNRRDGEEDGVEARDLQVGEGIIQPETQFKWTPEEEKGHEEEDGDEESPEDDEDDLDDDEEEDDDLDEDGDEEPDAEEDEEEPHMAQDPGKQGWAEGDIEEEASAEPDVEEEAEEKVGDDIDELMDELDDLLGTSDGPEDLPDPDEPTVDPGARF